MNNYLENYDRDKEKKNFEIIYSVSLIVIEKKKIFKDFKRLSKRDFSLLINYYD